MRFAISLRSACLPSSPVARTTTTPPMDRVVEAGSDAAYEGPITQKGEGSSCETATSA